LPELPGDKLLIKKRVGGAKQCFCFALIFQTPESMWDAERGPGNWKGNKIREFLGVGEVLFYRSLLLAQLS